MYKQNLLVQKIMWLSPGEIDPLGMQQNSIFESSSSQIPFLITILELDNLDHVEVIISLSLLDPGPSLS